MAESVVPSIEVLTPADRAGALPELIALLQAVVAGEDASVGFLPPLSEREARAFWERAFDEVGAGSRVLLVARLAGTLVGTAQLELAAKPNARHRAEVQKLLVLPGYRGLGLGRQLMQRIELAAREHERTLLVLDTRRGDVAEQLYRTLGYREVGAIPFFARNSAGTLDPTVIFYKYLGDDAPPAAG